MSDIEVYITPAPKVEIDIQPRVTETISLYTGIQGPAGRNGVDGAQGQPGPVGAIQAVTYTQSTPLAIWTVTHNFGRRPSVEVFDNAGNEVFADIYFPNLNTVSVEFAHETTGMLQLF